MQLFSSEFYRIFKNTLLLEHSWASASDFIFDMSNKYMKSGFYQRFFTEKDKTKKPSGSKTRKS